MSPKQPMKIDFDAEIFRNEILPMCDVDRGIYISFITLQILNNYVEKDFFEQKIKNYCKNELRIKCLFKKDELGYYNERIRKEVEKRKKLCKSRSDNIKKRYDKTTK